MFTYSYAVRADRILALHVRGTWSLTLKENTQRRCINNSMALVLERTIPTERPPIVGEVNAHF
jgi:hypothetical protein